MVMILHKHQNNPGFGSEDDYLSPTIGLGLALDIDRYSPRPYDRDASTNKIIDRWRLEDACHELFCPGRKYYSRSKVLLVLETLLKDWELDLQDVLILNKNEDNRKRQTQSETDAYNDNDDDDECCSYSLIRFHYGVRNYHWTICLEKVATSSTKPPKKATPGGFGGGGGGGVDNDCDYDDNSSNNNNDHTNNNDDEVIRIVKSQIVREIPYVIRIPNRLRSIEAGTRTRTVKGFE